MRKNALTRAMGVMTAAAALLCAAGCEIIGLGAAVDAAPPAIYISTPTVNQAVSSTFDITGTCTDDTGVREIRIQELRHNDDPNISYKDLGKISPNSDGGTWGITLEHNGDFSYTFNGRQMDLPDGTYIIETTANDGSRDSSNPAARAFDIDNTPPIFLVSSPNSIEGSVGKSYGREIAITGTIADGHDITKMRVKAYDNDGNEISLAKSEFNVPDKALVSVILAKYDAVTEEAYESLDPDAKILQQNYMRLFGRTENVFTEPISTVGYANVSIAIELEDKAGNKSERTFLSDGLTSLARANAGLDESTIIDSATYMYILNGNNTVSVPLSDAGKAVVRNALLGIGDNDTYKFMSYDGETNHKRLIMKINPDNSPTYKVSGYAIDAENTKWKDLPNEAQITLEIKSGRDGYTFKPSDLKVCIYEEDGNGGLTKDPSYLKWFYDKNTRYDKFMESGDSIRGLASTTQGTYQIILPGSDESPFVQNKKYYLVVEGKDANDNAMVPENGAYYGFKIMESGKAPWLECEDAGKYRKLENVLSSGNTDSKLTVTIYDQENKITSYNGPDNITYDVEWFEGHYESVSELAERTPVLRQLGNQIGKNGIAPVSQTQNSVQIPLGSPASTSATNYTIKVSVTANNGAASSNKTSYLVYADGKAPVITLENPELESSGSKKINSDTSGYIVETDPATGNVSHFYELRGKVKDVDGSGVYRIYVSYNGSRYEVTDTPQVTAETGWRYKLPVVEGTGQTIRIEAVDKNENNVLEDPVTGITMDFEPPVVGLVSIKEGDGTPTTITSVADIAEYYNQKPITVRVGITDSIGVAENGISILTYRDDTRINENFYVETSVATDRSYEDIKLKTDGRWKVVVQATDMAGAKSKEFTFELMIDTTKPVINNDAAVEGLTAGYTSSDVVKISGTANEQGTGLSKVEYKLTDSNGTTSPDWISSAATGTGANTTFNLSVSGLTTANGGHNVIEIRLVDKAGNPSEPKTFEVNVDNAAPVITSEYYKSGSGAREEIPSVIYYNSGDATERTFYGTISDEGGISGVQLYADGSPVSSGVTYTYTTASSIAYDTSSSWVALPANGIVTGWKAELDPPVAGNITVKATDKAGHVSSAQVTKFISDATAPVLTVTNLSDNGSIRETDRNADGSYTLRGTWSDAGSGTKELQWSVDGENFTTVSESDAPKTTGTANWAVNIPGTSLSETESFAITLKASDNAGNMTERQITGISYDLGAPNIRINKINGTSVSSLEKYYKRDANALSIEILADDSLGVDDIEIVSAKRNGSAAESTDYNFSTEADGVNKKGTITIARDGSGDGAWEIKLRAKDKVGRYSQELLISTTVDGTNPSVNISAATAEGTLVGNDSDKWFKNTTIRVGASASDEGSSKLKEIYYQVVSSSIGSVPEDITGESNAETASVSGSSASFNVTVSDLPGTNASGTNWVLLQAVDNAGNKSGVEKVIINVDTDDPALSALFADEDSDGAGLVEIPGTKYFNSDTQDFTIYGAVSDAGGLASLVFAVDGTPVTPESLKYSTVAPSSAAAITGNISSYTEYSSENKYAIKAWSAKFKLSEFVSGGKLSATATDVSGRKTILTNIIQFTNDSTPPVLVIRTPSDDALITENSLTGDNFVVSGTWSDAGGSGAKQMEWSLDGNSYRNDYVNAPETTASATWQISIPKTELTAGSGKTIYVKAADAAGNWSNPSSVTGITCDYELPELVLESPSSLGSTYARSDSDLDLTFAATDDRGISAIVVDSIKVDDAVVNLSEHPIPPYTITPVDSDGKSVLSIRRDGTLDGKWVIKVRATDSSERDSEPVTVSTIIDATAPTVTMDSSDAWYNNNIVRLNASASDTGGSGLATVYFAVVPSTDSTHRDDIRSEAGVDHVSIAGNSSEFSITVRNLAESTADLTNKILLQAEDGAGNLGTVTAVSGFKVDQTVPNIESKFYTYDGSSTNAHYEAASGTVLSSKSGTLTIYGNIDDKNASLGTNGAVQSGIKNLSFSLVPSGGGNARNLSATVTYSTTEIDTESTIDPDSFVGYSQIGAEAIRSYKAVINAANLDSGNMRAVLTDMAENVTSQTIFTVENDEVKPEINLRTPATVVTWSNSVSQNPTGTPAKVNGKITVSGSASDNSALSSVKLYWRTNGIGGVDMNSGWNYVTEFNGNNAYNWSREFEMTRTDSGTGNIYFLDGSPFSGSAKEVEIKVEAEDKASNKANRVFKYVMDPESDRPEIKLSNISLKTGQTPAGADILLKDGTRTWLLSDTIYGIVTDDDGVKELWYKIGADGTETQIPVQNGSWTLNVPGEDGVKDLYFRVKDGENTEFISRPYSVGSYDYCSTPVLSDTEGHTLRNYSILGLNVDTNPPAVGNIMYKISKDEKASWEDASTDFTNGKFGGNYKWLKVLMTADDTNGIESVEYWLNGVKTDPDESESVYNESYCSEEIDLSGLATDTYTLKTVVTDKAGSKTEKTVTFNVDNTAPVITISEPQDLIKAAVSMYGTVNELGGKTYFAVTLPSNTAPASDAFAAENESADGKWMEIKGVSLSYNVTFDGNPTTAGATHTDMFKKYIPMLYSNVTQAMIDDGSYENETALRFHVMSVDKCGNTSFAYCDVNIDPQGTRPTADISYPSKNSVQTLGGTVTLMGIATDTAGAHVGVKDVGVMIDTSGDGQWDYTDIAALHSKAPYLTFKEYDPANKTAGLVDIDFESISSGGDSEYYKNISVGTDFSGAAWSLEINVNKEFDPAENEDPVELTVWVFAVDNDGDLSPIDITRTSPKMKHASFKIDGDTPQWDNAKFVRTEGSNTIVKNFENNGTVSLKGTWYFESDFYDNNGIESITVDGVKYVENKAVASGKESLVTALTDGKGYHIKFLVGENSSAEVFKETHEIVFKEIKDKDPLSGNIVLDLQFDNMAPVIATDEDAGYNIIKYEAPAKNRVVNYNGFYTFGSWAKEEPVNGVNQTGVSRVAVYFTRDVGNDAHDGIFDPMIAKDATGNRSSVTDLAYEDNLYWRTVGISTGQAANHTLILAGSDPNIHKGGLIKVNGIIYRIDRVDGSTLTLDTSFAGHGTAGTAKIAIANVVDNPLQEGDGTGEKNAAGYWTNPALDDGDCMIESFIKQGSKCTWDANINTRNIGDGTAYLHYVVFDEAGNSSHESVPIYIGNNLPRVAGLKFATDNSTNGDYEGDEICDDYSGLYAGGKDGRNDVTKIVFPSESTDAAPVAIATVKNKMLLQPEIVGGNGNLKYVASIAKRNGSTGWNAPYKTLAETALKNNLGSQLVGSTDDTAKEGKVEFTVPYMISNGFLDGDNQKLKLLVKDSTPGESMEAEVSVILNLALRDSNPPVIKIRPFYWNSSAENSLFGNSTKNGHIELPSDLPESFVSDGTGVDDRQPKVSGKIKIEGIAQDDAQLRVIKLDVFGTEKTVGTYNGAWEIGEELTSGGEIPASGYAFTVEQAKYSDLIREGIITAVPEGKEEDDKVNYFSAEYGHVVKWTAYIDTAKVMTDAAETDREIKAYAVDRGTPNATGSDYENPNHSEDNDVSAFKEDGDNEGAQSGGTNGSGVHTDFYAVDVVPYITDVTTALSLTKKNNPSVYSRSALGHYPVAATETVKMTGFNLAGGTVKFNAETGTADVAYNASGFAIPSGAKSGNVSISVNGVGSLNNKNGNDSHGSYAKTVDLSANPTGDKVIYGNYYNRQPNGDNNNLLTDDVVIDIWQFKDAGISQTSGYITEPIMKVNPKNGMLNFGFNSGPANYCMANGENTSYTTWVGNYARFSTCGFTVDENGVTHGITVGLDTNPGDSGSAGRLQYFTSKWGRSQLDSNGNYEGKNSSRIDNIGAPAGTYNGVSFDGYVFIEDRFASPSLTTAVHGSDTYVYLAYYDDLNGQIRFKYGNLSKTTVGTSDTITTNPSGQKGISFEQFADQRRYKLANGSDINDNTHTAFDSNSKPEYYSVIAGSSQTAKAGNYLSIDVIKGSTAADDVVVATWYDATAGKWYYSYKVNPCNDNDMAASPSNTPTSGNWRKPIELKANAGENCQITVDKAGGIHIASYDTENANLLYAYLSSYDDATPQVVTVDAYAFTGTNIRLDTAVSDDGGHIVPYIGYYMSSTQKPKMAYLPDVISASGIKADREAVTILHGADDSEAVTGNWESSIIPSSSRYADNYSYSYVNIGLWKDASTGKAKIMTGTDVAYTNKSGLKQENTSKVYGNGTANPVLAYATRVGTRGHLETAQMK